VYQPAIFGVPEAALRERSYPRGDARIEIISGGTFRAISLIFGVLKPPCQSYCDEHSIWLAIETVHIFRGSQTGFLSAPVSGFCLKLQAISAPVGFGSGAIKQEQPKVWHGTPIASLSVTLFLS
jgi:hypothetical protein